MVEQNIYLGKGISLDLTIHGAAGSMNPWSEYIGAPHVGVCIGVCLHRYAKDGYDPSSHTSPVIFIVRSVAVACCEPGWSHGCGWGWEWERWLVERASGTSD